MDIWNNTPYTGDVNNNNVPVANRIRSKARRDVLKNKTIEFSKGDYVRVKLSQLYSQVRKMIKQGDKKFVVVKYTPEIYEIDQVLKPDHEGYEKLRYTLKDLDGNILLTQQKMNNPNKPRQQKRFFASDFLKVDKKDIPNDVVKVEDKNHIQRDGFDIHKALKLNVMKDAETEANRPIPPRPERAVRETPPVQLREQSARTRTPSSRLVYPSEIGLRTPTKQKRTPSKKKTGGGFVLVGGVKHFL
jgi:hypothetical protein